MDAYSYLPEHCTPFVTNNPNLPHRKPTEQQKAMRSFFDTHVFSETRNPDTGKIKFEATAKA